MVRFFSPEIGASNFYFFMVRNFDMERFLVDSMQRTDELVWKERRLMYLRQLHLYRMQMSTRSLKNRRGDEDGALMPVSNVSRKSFTMETSVS